MDVHSFTFTLENVPDDHELVANKLFDSGCDDAFLHASDDHVFLDFDREHADLWEAISSALQAVETRWHCFPPIGSNQSMISSDASHSIAQPGG